MTNFSEPTHLMDPSEDSPFHYTNAAMYKAVSEDIALLDPGVVKKRSSYKQMAFVLAKQIDLYDGREGGTAADRSALARMLSELRTVMDRLTGVAEKSDDGEGRRISIPQ